MAVGVAVAVTIRAGLLLGLVGCLLSLPLDAGSVGCVLTDSRGFRLGPGGAQEKFGVTPDISTFGKAIANGFPVAAMSVCTNQGTRRWWNRVRRLPSRPRPQSWVSALPCRAALRAVANDRYR